MARVKTNNDEHRVVDEGRTGRIIDRRALRAGLGNPKKRKRDLQELLFEMYVKGVKQGDTLRQLKIQNATALLTYEEEKSNDSTNVPAVETAVPHSGNVDAMSESTLGSVVQAPEECPCDAGYVHTIHDHIKASDCVQA